MSKKLKALIGTLSIIFAFTGVTKAANTNLSANFQYNPQVSLAGMPVLAKPANVQPMPNTDINKQIEELKSKIESLKKVTPMTEDIKKQISEIENKIKTLTNSQVTPQPMPNTTVNADLNKQISELKSKIESLKKVTPMTEDIKKQISEIENKIKMLTNK